MQSLARQRSALDAVGCDQIIEEAHSGVKAQHCVDRLLSRLQAGDELFVTGLDRLGRSTGEAIVLMDELIRRGVALGLLALPSLDNTINGGRLIADILARLAAPRRRRGRDRPLQGIAVAKAAGRRR
jgi:DNA invertase Pin-like site-specific DNA recombinase